MMKIIDTHAHYDDEKFDDDRAELLQSLHDAGVLRIIDPGCDLKSSLAAQKLARETEFVYFAAGIHPEELDDLPDDWLVKLREMAADKKCVAIGEIGLDYYWDASRRDLQQQIFREQLLLARELGKPVIVHDREAHGDCFAIVTEVFPELSPENAPGVFHCYSGSAEMASELLRHGWYLGFDGPLTYKNARKNVEVLEVTPMERILTETDSPYLSPVPMRGKRNDSGNLKYILSKMAEIKNLPVEQMAEITFGNAMRLFFNRVR